MLGCVACGFAPSRSLRHFADAIGRGKAVTRRDRFSVARVNPALAYLRIAKGVCERCKLPPNCDPELKGIAVTVLDSLSDYLSLLAGEQGQGATRTRPRNFRWNRSSCNRLPHKYPLSIPLARRSESS
jgi:hypothetical protein